MIQQLIGWSISALLALAVGLSWPIAAGAAPPDNTLPENASQALIADASRPTARQVFEDAYDHRYTWDENFPGYQAEASVTHLGELDHGIVRVMPDLTITLTNFENEVVEDIVRAELEMEAVHRQRVPFAERHQQQSFEFIPEDDEETAHIRESGTGFVAYYKVRDRKVVQVERVLGDVAVTVNTLGWITPPEGYLPAHFQVFFKDPESGEILQQRDVRDFHEKIGGYYLLTKRGIRIGEKLGAREKPLADTWIRFNDIQPLGL
jgi:hypothetical protein